MRGSTLPLIAMSVLLLAVLSVGAWFMFFTPDEITDTVADTNAVADDENTNDPRVDRRDFDPEQPASDSTSTDDDPINAPSEKVKADATDKPATDANDKPTPDTDATTKPMSDEDKRRADLDRAAKELEEALEDLPKEFKLTEMTFTIEGDVVDATGAPVPNADIYAEMGTSFFTSSDSGLERNIIVSSSGGNKGTPVGQTDAGGHFRIEVKKQTLGSGGQTVKVSAGKSGYADSQSKRIRIKSGDEKTGIRLTLKAAGSIRGRVVDESGRPVVGATVSAKEGLGDDRTSSIIDFAGVNNGGVKTDTNGEYLIEGLAAGTQSLTVNMLGHRVKSGPRSVDVVANIETRVADDFVLRVITSVVIPLIDADGNPIKVPPRYSLQGEGRKRFGKLSDGKLVIERIDPGTTEIEISAWGYKPVKVTVTATEGQITEQPTVALEVDPDAKSTSSRRIEIPALPSND